MIDKILGILFYRKRKEQARLQALKTAHEGRLQEIAELEWPDQDAEAMERFRSFLVASEKFSYYCTSRSKTESRAISKYMRSGRFQRDLDNSPQFREAVVALDNHVRG